MKKGLNSSDENRSILTSANDGINNAITYRDKYYDGYLEFLKEITTQERRESGKKPYSIGTIKTIATDSFYLEKHESDDFISWFVSDEAFRSAEKVLVNHFTGKRDNPERDAQYCIERMGYLRRYFKLLGII